MNLFQQSIKNLTGSFCCKYLGDDAYENIVEWYIDNPPTKAEVEAELARLTAEQPLVELRAKRNQLLTETDYLALADSTLTDEMRDYRQALRDLPANTVDPANPVFPTKPEV